MAIFKSISSLSNIKAPMKLNLISSSLTSGDAYYGKDATSLCLDGSFDAIGKFSGSDSNFNIIDLKLNISGGRHRC